MDKMDLKKYGITGVTEIVYNPSYDELFREETKKGLRGYEKGQLTETGAVNVMTGVYTGRSPKDKFFVMDETTKDTIWWTSDEYKNDNKPVTKKAWKELKKIAVEELSGKKLFVVDTFCGANENSRLKIRFIMEVAWQAHFVKNMFIRPTDEELENYGEPDFVVLNASKAKVKNYKELGLNSETAVVFNLTEKMQVIINTWYGGEMKKGMFSYMNYLLPLKGMASMHCSANTNEKGETAIFFVRRVKEPKNSYFTLELDEGKLVVRQNRGRRNCARTKEVEELEAVWLAWLKAGAPRDAKGRPVVPEQSKQKEVTAT